MPYTAADIAKLLGGEVAGDESLVLKGFAPADRAQSGDLTFAENESYFARAEQSAASAIIVDGPYASNRKTILRVPNARLAFAKVLPLFFPEPAFAAGIHPTAILAPTAQVDPTAHIGPYCVVGDQVRVGPRAVLQGGNHVGANCLIDEDTNIFPHVTLGEHCIIVSQVGIAGSTKLGNYVILGGQVGLAGHLKIGNRVSVAAQSGVMSNIPDGEKWLWSPAQPDRQAKRQMIALQQLPELFRRVKELERQAEAKSPSVKES